MRLKSRSIFLLTTFLLLLITGGVATFISFQPVSPTTLASKISERLQDQLRDIDQKATYFQSPSNHNFNPETTKDYSFFEYKNHQLLRWTDNRFVPTLGMVSDTFSVRLLKTSTGYYVAKKWTTEDGGFLVAVIPLRREFKIVNDYLSPEWNGKIFSHQDIVILEPGVSAGVPVYVKGQCVFKIAVTDGRLRMQTATRWVAVIALLFSCVAIVFFLYSQQASIKRKQAEWGFVFLAACLIPLRMIMVSVNFPNVLINARIFDPKYFASSSYNASMGDLILNELVVAILCYYLFRNYHRFAILKVIGKKHWLRMVLSFVSALLVLFSVLYPFVVIQTIYHNSSIQLNISQSLHFDILRIAAIMAVLISWVSTFLFCHVFIRLVVIKERRWYSILSFSAAAVIFLGINLVSGQEFFSSLVTGCVYFAVVYSLTLYSSLNRLRYATFTYLFVAIFCFAANSAYCIEFYDREERVESQFRFANNFLIDRDYFGEYLLHESAVKIGQDAFIQRRINSPFLSKDIIRQKVRQVFLPSYFNKYDIGILLFNSSGDPLDNHSTATFSKLINLYDQDAFKTDYKEVYFINSPSNEVTQKNLVIVPIHRSGIVAGYVIIELSMKKIIPENVYPELLVDNRFQQFYKTQDFSYAVFSNNNISFSSGDFNYDEELTREWIANPALYTAGIKDSGYIHIAQEDDLGKVAVVSSKNPSPGYVLSNFSFLFVLGLSILLIVILIQGATSFFRGTKLFFSARIQLFLNLSFFLPLIIVSVTTLGLTTRSSQEQLDSEYLRKSKAFGSQIASYLDAYLKELDENQISFENRLTDLAHFASLDANVYNLNGILMATSQPLIFEKNLLSAYVNPLALQKIRTGENLLIEKEEVGKLDYFVSYSALKSPQTGKLLGILAIPFFQSTYSLEKIQVVIFTNILNIFAAIFIILLIVSYFVSEWLTFPLKFITQSLRKTSLTKANQPLRWQANDEIGLMVKEYNQMLFKLGESKIELEQTQRERAWREIAQQVAHEIKNPLTPMKLTLQQMERLDITESTSQEKIKKAFLSLLTQVDTLNDIASSFSAFAKMPEPVIQKIELISLLRRIINLHAQSGELIFKPGIKELFVTGDEQLIGRTFSNIIINAFQAARPGINPRVVISILLTHDKCTVSFSDNGHGITPENADRVFVPHFSTKKTGSGLGLAIAKQSLEHMGGKIWFKTTSGKGSVFYIELRTADDGIIQLL